MVMTPKPPATEPPKRNHEVALWSGAAAFFGSLATIAVFDILDPAEWVEFFGALVVALITAGGVYSKQRYEDAKKLEGQEESP